MRLVTGVHRGLADGLDATTLVLVGVVDAGCGVSGLIHVDRTGGSGVIDVLTVGERLDGAGQVGPGVLGTARSGDVDERIRHLLAVGRTSADRGEIAEDGCVELLSVERLTLD